MFFQMLKSSTQDGLAPLSLFALSMFIYSFCGVAILWGIFNLILLLRIGPQNNQDELITPLNQGDNAKQLGKKVILGSLHYMKFNTVVVFAATVVYFLAIMGAVEQFHSSQLSVIYLLGVVASLLCSFFIVFVSSFSYFKVVYSAKYAIDDAFGAAKNASNSITFICTGVSLASLMGLMMYSEPADKLNQDEINKRANRLLSFAFGYITVAMCTKIISLTYSKGVQNSFQVSSLFNHDLKKDDKHPMVICKAIGETVNKSLSKTLDYLMIMLGIIGITTKIAGMNVFGVDLKGQITFSISVDNSYSGMLLIGYSLFFTVLLSLFRGSPSTDIQVKQHFRINIVGITILLSGFTALACYLTLPAEFQMVQFILQNDKSVKSPLLAYLSVLIGMFVSLLISLSAEIISSNLFFIYSILKACKTGAATCLISGLSTGYLYNFIPIVILAPFGFLCYFWLGSFGVCMGLTGIAMYIPYYMNLNLYHSIMNTSSLVGFISKSNQSSMGSLIGLNESKKYFEQKIFVYFNQIVCLFGYATIAAFSQHSKLNYQISQPHLFSGLLAGSMIPYLFSAVTINSSYRVAPVICFDIQQQVQQNPDIKKGNVELDYHRSNHLFTLNCTIQMIRFLSPLILPTIITGMILSLQSIFGLMCGLILSSVQISISNSMSGTLWGAAKDEISYGRAKDEDDNEISGDSQWARASQVGFNVGSNLKQCTGQSLYVFAFWTLISATIFEDVYIKIHSN